MCSSCVIDKFLITKQFRYWSDDEDDQDDDHDSRVSPDFNAQKLHRINQRKGLCFIQASSDDKDDKDDDHDSRVSPDRMPKICAALNKEKALLHSGIE